MFPRRNRPQQPQQPRKSTTELARTMSKQPEEVLYHPSIFRYTCRGRLRLDSKTPTAGVCQGFQSQLEHVDHWRLCSKEEAVQVFQQKSIDDEPPPDATTSAQDATTTAHALQNIYLSNVLVYPSSKDEEEGSSKTTKPPKEPQDEQWSCVGTTEVDLLVLRPPNSKEESIAAVSPYCSPGMTVRDVSTPTLGRDRTSTIRLGIVEIVYQSSMTEEDLEEEEEASSSSSPAPLSSDKKQQSLQQESNKNTTEPKESISKLTKFSNAGTGILNQMQINAQLLYQATQEEFPQRTYQASQRVIQECHKTWDRMGGLLKRIASWQDDDDEK